MKVSAQYAQEHFPDILTAASSGEEVEISRPGQPAFVLLPGAPSIARLWLWMGIRATREPLLFPKKRIDHSFAYIYP